MRPSSCTSWDSRCSSAESSFGLSPLRPTEVGLGWSDLPSAIALVLLVWVAAQVLGRVLGVATAHTVQLNPLWERRGVSGVLGLLLAQVLGNALLEEVGFRGFLMPQLNLRLRPIHAVEWRWP